jgi:hypothetical protein
MPEGEAAEGRDFFVSYTGADRAWAEWIGLASPGSGGQERLHPRQGLVGELQHRGCSWGWGASRSATAIG